MANNSRSRQPVQLPLWRRITATVLAIVVGPLMALQGVQDHDRLRMVIGGVVIVVGLLGLADLWIEWRRRNQ